MKKLSYLLGLFVITGLLFSSCEKDEEENTPPSLAFLGGVHEPTNIPRTDGDVEMETGNQLVFGFSASSTTSKNLSRVLITRNYENVSLNTMIDSTIAVPSISFDLVTVSYPIQGTELFEITVFDKNGLSSTISFTVTTTAPSAGISIYDGVELGSYTSTANSSFASITGETFSLAEAEEPDVQSKISWIYFHGVTNGHTFMSPANEDIEQIYPGVAGWENRNTTLFKKTTLSTEQYDIIENKNQLIISISTGGASDMSDDFFSELSSNPGGFAPGDVIAFEAKDGKLGLLKLLLVNEGATNGDSWIKYDVKVED